MIQEWIQAVQALRNGTVYVPPGMTGQHAQAWAKWQEFARAYLTGNIPHYPAINMKGNTKLSFATFSTLPLLTCPGAGACKQFCYSLKTVAMRPYAAQLMARNTILEESKPGRAFLAYQIPAYGVLRLFVDGDLREENIGFWKKEIAKRPNLKVYGYSKSLRLILDNANNWPENWVLNLSSGHNASDETESEFSRLPFVRGRFLAYSMGKKIRQGTASRKDIKHDRKFFLCPGKCDKCTPAGPLCALPQAKIDIINPVH